MLYAVYFCVDVIIRRGCELGMHLRSRYGLQCESDLMR